MVWYGMGAGRSKVDYLLGAHRDERELAQVFSAWAQQSGILHIYIYI